MVRFSERSISIGLCVAALSIVVPSLLLKINQHHSREQEWSSKQSGSVSAGAVREEVPAADATPQQASSPDEAAPPARSSTDQKIESSAAPDAVQSSARDAIGSSTPQRTARAHSNVKSSPTRPAPTSRQAKGPTPVHAQARPSTEVSKLLPDAQNGRHEAAAENVPASSATDPALMSRSDANAVRDSSQAPPQHRAVQAGEASSTHASAAMTTGAPHPKTRKDVEDELRNARMNGSLPRFGNPDPYGPGGSPSGSSE
jgi:hypothetical protein